MHADRRLAVLFLSKTRILFFLKDMKCVGVQYMEALRRLIKQGKTFKRTIHIVWGPDEEIGSTDGMMLFVKTEEFRRLNVGFVLDGEC